MNFDAFWWNELIDICWVFTYSVSRLPINRPALFCISWTVRWATLATLTMIRANVLLLLSKTFETIEGLKEEGWHARLGKMINEMCGLCFLEWITFVLRFSFQQWEEYKSVVVKCGCCLLPSLTIFCLLIFSHVKLRIWIFTIFQIPKAMFFFCCSNAKIFLSFSLIVLNIFMFWLSFPIFACML